MKKFSIIILSLALIIVIVYYSKQFYQSHKAEENARNAIAIGELNLALKQVQDVAKDRKININMDSLITNAYVSQDRLQTISRLIQIRDSLLFVPINDSVTITQ